MTGNDTTGPRHSANCVCAQCQAEQLRAKAAHQVVNPLPRIERDKLARDLHDAVLPA